jgi:hypothetical protein
MSNIVPTGYKSEAINVTATAWALTMTDTGRRPVGIHCNAESTIVGALLQDATEQTWVLQPGTTAYAFKSINTTSTTKTGMMIIYG